MRYKCICSYDGTSYHGFQIQKNGITIQEGIEKSLFKLLKSDITIHPSGRTDAGVHALGQVFHFDTDIKMEEWNMKRAINSYLPGDIYIKAVEIVADSFHSRFSALTKEYHYLLDFGEYNPILRNYRLFYPRKINLDQFKEAFSVYQGVHDFQSFTKNKDLENTIRDIKGIEFEEESTLFKVKIVGNGFLRHMVRILVAMALEVGIGKVSLQELKSILEAKNRQLSPKIVPASGLYLYKVNYY